MIREIPITITTQYAFDEKAADQFVAVNVKKATDYLYDGWKNGVAASRLELEYDLDSIDTVSDMIGEIELMMRSRHPNCDLALEVVLHNTVDGTEETRKVFLKGIGPDVRCV